MSSNIRVNRICQYCKKEFEAKKTTSKTCSDHCAKMLYKQKKRTGKIEAVQQETHQLKLKPLEELKAKEFLTVREVARLINCSLRTTYRLIAQGNINAVNLSERKTIVRRADIDKLFQQPKEEHSALPFDEANHYTLVQVREVYGISDSALHALIQRNGISKKKLGSFTYVPKEAIDKIFQ